MFHEDVIKLPRGGTLRKPRILGIQLSIRVRRASWQQFNKLFPLCTSRAIYRSNETKTLKNPTNEGKDPDIIKKKKPNEPDSALRFENIRNPKIEEKQKKKRRRRRKRKTDLLFFEQLPPLSRLRLERMEGRKREEREGRKKKGRKKEKKEGRERDSRDSSGHSPHDLLARWFRGQPLID